MVPFLFLDVKKPTDALVPIIKDILKTENIILDAVNKCKFIE